MMPTALSVGVDDKGTTLDKSGITSEATDRYDQRFGWEGMVDTKKKSFTPPRILNTDGITEILRRVYDRN